MIEIHGVSKQESDMLDKIWQFQTEDEFIEWFDTLKYSEKLMCSKLLETLRIELIDSENVDDFPQADLVLSKYKK